MEKLSWKNYLKRFKSLPDSGLQNPKPRFIFDHSKTFAMLVLYVDDDIDDREMFTDAVKVVAPQISTLSFESGQALLDFLHSNKTVPAYIFIDINMPKMNGYECAEEIRSKPHLRQVQIVMYSTAFNPNDLAEFAKLQFEFLVKPNKFGDLVQSIKDLIG